MTGLCRGGHLGTKGSAGVSRQPYRESLKSCDASGDRRETTLYTAPPLASEPLGQRELIGAAAALVALGGGGLKERSPPPPFWQFGSSGSDQRKAAVLKAAAALDK